MRRKFVGQASGSWVAVLCLVAAAAAWVLFAGGAEQQELTDASKAALRKATGQPQLVSVEPYPMADGDMCQWMPASASTTLLAALRQQRLEAGASAAAGAGGSSIDVDREPVRVIRDTSPTYSAVGVNLNTNEVFLQDENLFGLMVFDRLTNTPPSARFSEPKRRLRGHNTRLEFNCSLYIDPQSGDIYSVNNDMVDRMVVFPSNAEGDMAPMRQLHTPHRTFGIAVDEEAEELYLTIQHPPQVVVYRKTAEGEDLPLRILRGDRTQLEDAHGIAIDTKNNWMFVSNHGAIASKGGRGGQFKPPAITVYPLQAKGDTAPLRVIEGPRTRLNWPALIALDQESGDLYVANDMDHSILVFQATDSGDVAPTRVIKGPKTGILNPTSIFLDTKNGELWVSNMGNHSATVYPLTANGDVAPLRTIRSAPAGKLAQMIGNPGGVGYDTKREEILVPN